MNSTSGLGPAPQTERLSTPACGLRRTVIPTFCRCSRAISRHFALSESKMAAKTTSGSCFDPKFRLCAPGFLLESGFVAVYRQVLTKVRTDSSTEFGSNPILTVQICTALDRAVDFNKRVTAFTTGEPAERVHQFATSKVGFDRCTHRASHIENRQHSHPDGTPASANH